MSNWLEDYLRDNVGSAVGSALGASADADVLMPEMTVQKMSAYIPVSYELMMDAGAIPDTRPPRKPLTRRERFRWWRSGLRDRFATWLYERVSGDKFPDLSDY
jgi:hypothetical protein